MAGTEIDLGVDTSANAGGSAPRRSRLRLPRRESNATRRSVAAIVLLVIGLRLLFVSMAFAQHSTVAAAQARVFEQVREVGPTESAFRTTWDALTWGDPDWYLSIAEKGYANRPFTTDRQENWGFFPGWPVVIRYSDPVIPGGAATAAVIAANILSLVGLWLLYRLLRLDFDDEIAFLATGALAVSPFAYHFMRAGTESLFFVAVVAAFYFARREHWLLAGAAGAVATSARLQGLLLAPALLFIAWGQWRSGRKPWLAALGIVGVPLSLFAFMAYLAHLTGNAMAYFDIQRAQWGQGSGFPFASVVGWFLDRDLLAIYGWELMPLTEISVIAITTMAVIGIARRRQWSIPIEYLGLIWLSLLLVVSRDFAVGAGRYMLPVFPLFIVTAFLVRRRPFVIAATAVAFTAIQTFLAVGVLTYVRWTG